MVGWVYLEAERNRIHKSSNWQSMSCSTRVHLSRTLQKINVNEQRPISGFVFIISCLEDEFFAGFA